LDTVYIQPGQTYSNIEGKFVLDPAPKDWEKGSTGSWVNSYCDSPLPELLWRKPEGDRWHLTARLRIGGSNHENDPDCKKAADAEVFISPGQTYSNIEGEFKLDK